tara:strand:- start:9106 stop:9864 length:759 start_codon:yes stop_codon:yes gene_type:complete
MKLILENWKKFLKEAEEPVKWKDGKPTKSTGWQTWERFQIPQDPEGSDLPPWGSEERQKIESKKALANAKAKLPKAIKTQAHIALKTLAQAYQNPRRYPNGSNVIQPLFNDEFEDVLGYLTYSLFVPRGVEDARDPTFALSPEVNIFMGPDGKLMCCEKVIAKWARQTSEYAELKKELKKYLDFTKLILGSEDPYAKETDHFRYMKKTAGQGFKGFMKAYSYYTQIPKKDKHVSFMSKAGSAIKGFFKEENN